MSRFAAPSRLAPGLVLLATALGAASAARAGDDSRVFTAGEFEGLAREGFTPAAPGRYTVKVWVPARQVWSLRSEGATLTLRPEAQGDDPTPRWQTLGAADLPAGAAVKVVVEADPSKAAEPEKTDEAKKGAAKEAGPVPVAVPGMLAIGTDPGFDPSPALDMLRGRLDSVEPPADSRRDRVRTVWQGVDFHAPATAGEWPARARAVREQVLITTGLWPMPPRTPLDPRVYGRTERDGYSIEKVVLETLPGFYLTGNLYRPAGAAGRRPAVLCPHGHSKDGRLNSDVQQRCVRLAKLGCVVFVYDMVGYADGKAFGHAFLNGRLRCWGLSLVTLQTWNGLRALDWVCSLGDVDAARVACTGESGGATQTLLLTAVDDRVKVAAPVVMVSATYQGGCFCENCAGLRLGTDNVEIAALAAPRPLKLVGASGDWTAETMTRAYPALRGLYALLGVEGRVSADVFDFPHNYNRTSRDAVYAFLGRRFLGVDDPSATREGEQSVESADDLRVFNGETPAPAALKTRAAVEADLVRLRAGQIEALAPADSAVGWEAARDLLRASHRVRLGVVDPPAGGVEAREVRRSARSEFAVEHWVVGRKGTGEGVPVVRLRPPSPSGKLTVIDGPGGKSALAGPGGQVSPLAGALLALGQTVVGFDPLLVGESVDPSRPTSARPTTDHYETYNPALAADRAQDLATVLAWARGQDGVRQVAVIGEGDSGPRVLLTLPTLAGLARAAVDLAGVDEGDGSNALPSSADLPGLLQFGGFKAAAALAAPLPLWAYRPGRSFPRPWPDRAYEHAGAAGAFRLDADRPPPEALARWVDRGE